MVVNKIRNENFYSNNKGGENMDPKNVHPS
jgi:hypothetical protein